jgi:hypothetical protein
MNRHYPLALTRGLFWPKGEPTGTEYLSPTFVPVSFINRNFDKPVTLIVVCFHAGFSLGLFFHPEDRDHMFFWVVGWLSTDCSCSCLIQLAYVCSSVLYFYIFLFLHWDLLQYCSRILSPAILMTWPFQQNRPVSIASIICILTSTPIIFLCLCC